MNKIKMREQDRGVTLTADASSCFSCMPGMRKPAHTDKMLRTAIAADDEVKYGCETGKHAVKKWKEKALLASIVGTTAIDVSRCWCDESILVTWLPAVILSSSVSHKLPHLWRQGKKNN